MPLKQKELCINLAFTLNVSECLNRERCLILLAYIVYKCNIYIFFLLIFRLLLSLSVTCFHLFDYDIKALSNIKPNKMECFYFANQIKHFPD